MLRQLNPDMFNLVFSGLHIGIVIFDRDGQVMISNDKYDELLGQYPHDKGLSFPFAKMVKDEIDKHLAEKSVPYARTLTIDMSGFPTGNVFIGTTFDINAKNVTGPSGEKMGEVICIVESSEHARKGEMLGEFLFHRGLILDNTFAGLIYLSTDFKVMWKRLRNLWDNQLEEMYKEGHYCYESYGRKTPCGDCPMLKSIKSGKVEKELRNMDDGTFLETIVIPVKKDDEVEGYIIHMSDVTERETMIEALRMAKEEVVEDVRLEEIFLNNMNHEIRTPLNAIIGFNDILNGVAGEHMGEEEKRQMKNHINKNANQLITLINDILDLSKMEKGSMTVNKTVVGLMEICFKAREAVKGQVQPGVKLKHEYPVSLKDTLLYTDGKRLEQLLRNVLSNACKHTSAGSITLKVSKIENGEGKRPTLQIRVNDTGVGIPKDKRKDLFTPFRKFHGATQGLGMGLAICKQIAKMLNGHIYLDHEYQGGSSFVFEMPMEEMP